MADRPAVHRDRVEKHPECIAVYGECPHWIVARESQVIAARVRGTSEFEFRYRTADVEEYLEAIAAAEYMRDGDTRSEVRTLVDDQHDALGVEPPAISDLHDRLRDEIERDEVRQPVVGLLNTIIQINE